MLGIHRLSGDEVKNVSSAQTGSILLGDGFREEFYTVANAVNPVSEVFSLTGWTDISTAAIQGLTGLVSDSGFQIQWAANANGEGIKTSSAITVDASSRYKISLFFIISASAAINLWRLKIGNTDGGTEYLSKTYDHPSYATWTHLSEYFSTDTSTDLYISLLEESASGDTMTMWLSTVSIKKFDSTDKNYAEGEFSKIIPITNKLEISAKSNIGKDLSTTGEFSVVTPNPFSLHQKFGTANANARASVIKNHHDGMSVYGNFSKVLVVDGEALLVPTTEQTIPRVTTINNQYSAFFDGVNDYITVPHNSSIDITTGDFTLSAWFRTTASSGTCMIMEKRTGGGVGYRLGMDNGNGLLAGAKSGSGAADAYSYIGVSGSNDGEWHHYVASFDRSANIVQYYDGILKKESESLTGVGDITNTIDLNIGANNTPASFFDGNLDEVSIWDKALSQDEIRYHLCDYNYDNSNSVRPMDLTLHDTFATNCKLWMRMGD